VVAEDVAEVLRTGVGLATLTRPAASQLAAAPCPGALCKKTEEYGLKSQQAIAGNSEKKQQISSQQQIYS
jgi:hypothetical protein